MVDSVSHDRTRDIAAVLANYPPDCQPNGMESLGAAGGMSGAQFWRLTTPRGGQILRRWPIEFPPPERLRFIHAVLRHAASRGIAFLPIPATTRNGDSFVEFAGHLWELAPWLPGTPNYAASPTVEKVESAMKALAKFHVAASDFPTTPVSGLATGSSAITSRMERLNELIQGGQRDLAEAIVEDHWPELAPLAREFLILLQRALPHAVSRHEPLTKLQFSLQPCIRDVWYENVLFTGNEVTGIVDFGAMDIDTPACDVARLLGSLVGPDATRRKIGLAAYDSVRQLSASELLAVDAFDTDIVILAGCNWIRWIYVDRRQFENSEKICQHFRRIVERARLIASPMNGF
jgi:Ser/Thr protein kinase RdoA (MazF antagonist)